ncbi:MAG: hypothetical protein V7724_00245 [Sediminicola sp.]|tara:strand:+ start:85686 stop:86045 length:360 start_codon:yes stop_codon:yes gene_type:complete
MKCAMYQLNNNTLEVFNSFFGKESVFLNGKKVSEKFSIFGEEHHLEIDGDIYGIRPILNWRKTNCMDLRIQKNGRELEAVNLMEKSLSRNELRTRIAKVLLAGISGAVTGFLLARYFLN